MAEEQKSDDRLKIIHEYYVGLDEKYGKKIIDLLDGIPYEEAIDTLAQCISEIERHRKKSIFKLK